MTTFWSLHELRNLLVTSDCGLISKRFIRFNSCSEGSAIFETVSEFSSSFLRCERKIFLRNQNARNRRRKYHAINFSLAVHLYQFWRRNSGVKYQRIQSHFGDLLEQNWQIRLTSNLRHWNAKGRRIFGNHSIIISTFVRVKNGWKIG